MFLDDDLPVWGFVGKVERARPHGLKDGLKDGLAGGGAARVFLFTHFHFDVAYNGDQVRHRELVLLRWRSDRHRSEARRRVVQFGGRRRVAQRAL